MTIEEIALQVAKEWQMAFGGAEWYFAIEVANRTAEAEREACAQIADSVYPDGMVSHTAASIRARSNA